MTAKAIKELVDQGKYQAVVDQLAQWEADGVFDTFTEQEQIECLFYQSFALSWGLQQWETALQIVLATRQKYPSPIDRSLLLALMVQQIRALSNTNRLDEAREVITEGDAILQSLTAKELETGAYWIAFFEDGKGLYYRGKNDWDTALECSQRALALWEKIGDLYAIALSLCHIGGSYELKGELDTALDYYQRFLDIAKQMENSSEIARALNRIGYIYLCKGELDTALIYYQQALGISEEIGSPASIIIPLKDLVNLYVFKGELDTALEYNRRCLSLSKKIENKKNLIFCFAFFAWIYYAKAELDTALDYVQQSLALQGTVGSSLFFPIFISAHIHYARGELDTALERFQRCLNMWERTGNDFMIAWILFPLIRVVLAQQNRSQAQEYLTRLQQLQTRTPNPWSHFSSRLAEALVLKQSPRAREKFQAQKILEQLVQEEVLWVDLTALAIIQLSDLLIAEVKLYGEPKVWEEAKALIDKLYVMAQDQPSFSMSVEALILQAKAAAVDRDLPQALKYYEQARLTATEKKLTGLLVKVDTEQKRFEAEFATWEELIQSNAPLQELVETAKMDLEKVRVTHKLGITEKEPFKYTEMVPPFEAYDGTDPYIFICYAHTDKYLVYPEIKRLYMAGYRIWYDEGIPPATEWSDEIAKAIEKCTFFVVFLSSQAI
ncbi:MAG: tetratricopeptide repeat protein, partial [Promethearchaeota archaeon]